VVRCLFREEDVCLDDRDIRVAVLIPDLTAEYLFDVERVHLFVVGRIPFLLHPEWQAEKGGSRLWRVTDWGMGIFVDSARSF
jgi:hypothetical protein